VQLLHPGLRTGSSETSTASTRAWLSGLVRHVYGVGNPNPSGYEKDAKELCKELGYFQIKFGMFGDVAMEPVVRQVQNVPEYIRDIVIVSGSGLSALSILKGSGPLPEERGTRPRRDAERTLSRELREDGTRISRRNLTVN
jgi:hypothetical protein